MTVDEVRKVPLYTIRTPYGTEQCTVIWDQCSGVFTAITAILDDETVLGYDVELNDEDDIFECDVTLDQMYHRSHYLTAHDLKTYV